MVEEGTSILEIVHRWHYSNLYSEDYMLMLSAHAKIATGHSPGVVILTRHAQCITTGLVGSYKEPWIRTDRGGGPTYHDRGQLICYPVIKLERFGIKSAEYNSLICSWVYNALSWALRAKDRLHEQLEIIENGIWLNRKKIAFIGTRIKQGVSLHGFAVNLFSNLMGFSSFNPCDKSGTEVGNLMIGHSAIVESLLKSSPFI